MRVGWRNGRHDLVRWDGETPGNDSNVG
jgi:hypothetical protein